MHAGAQSRTAHVAEAVVTASTRLDGRVLRTPLLRAPWLDGDRCTCYLKLENLQHTGSFKVRGATNFLLARGCRPGESVVAASTGNHGAAVAYAAASLGVRALVFAPRSALASKLSAVESLGGAIRIEGDDSVEAERAARSFALRQNIRYLSPYNDLDVIAGQGTIATELLADLDTVDAVVVAVGGGGLIAGVGAALKAAHPTATVVGVSPAASAAMAASLDAGRIVSVTSTATLSDGTAGGLEDGAVTFDLCKSLIDSFPRVDEAEIAAGMRDLLFESRVLGEGSAGCAIAGFKRTRASLTGNVVVIVCGGNVSPDTLRQILAFDG